MYIVRCLKVDNCGKCVQIRSYFWFVYTGKYGPEITPYLGTFHAMDYLKIIVQEFIGFFRKRFVWSSRNLLLISPLLVDEVSLSGFLQAQAVMQEQKFCICSNLAHSVSEDC